MSSGIHGESREESHCSGIPRPQSPPRKREAVSTNAGLVFLHSLGTRCAAGSQASARLVPEWLPTQGTVDISSMIFFSGIKPAVEADSEVVWGTGVYVAVEISPTKIAFVFCPKKECTWVTILINYHLFLAFRIFLWFSSLAFVNRKSRYEVSFIMEYGRLV